MSIIFRRYKRKIENVEEIEVKEPKRSRISIGSINIESGTALDALKMARLVFGTVGDSMFRSDNIGNFIHKNALMNS